MPSSKPIGIFDSGAGGVTVLAAIRRLLPNESLIYLGDSARLPYGNKSAETILRYSEECATFLAKQNVKAMIVACNTASAHALPFLQHRFHFPMMGVVEPGIETALVKSRTKHIGVIGTEATIASGIYEKQLKREEGALRITCVACPLFVPLVEEGWLSNEITVSVAKHYLNAFSETDVDTLILGCTHYPLLKSVIGKVLGEKVQLIDAGEAVAARLQHFLREKDLQSEEPSSFLRLFLTDQTPHFKNLAEQFLGERLPNIERAFVG